MIYSISILSNEECTKLFFKQPKFKPENMDNNNYLELLEAAKNVLRSWDEGLNGDREQLKHSLYPEMPDYWSPASAMVRSEHIAKLRAVIQNCKPTTE